jgi:hypothetical protein
MRSAFKPGFNPALQMKARWPCLCGQSNNRGEGEAITPFFFGPNLVFFLCLLALLLLLVQVGVWAYKFGLLG